MKYIFKQTKNTHKLIIKTKRNKKGEIKNDNNTSK